MFTSLTLNNDFGYVVLAGAASGMMLFGTLIFPTIETFFLGFMVYWKAFQVGAARKKYGIKYPKMYSDENGGDNVFNCVQVSYTW